MRCLLLSVYVAGACLWLLVSAYAWAEHHGERRGEEMDQTRALRVVTAPLWFAWIAYWLALAVYRLAVDLEEDSKDVDLHDLLGAVDPAGDEGGWRHVTYEEMVSLRCSVRPCSERTIIAYRPVTGEVLCAEHLTPEVCDELFKNWTKKRACHCGSPECGSHGGAR